MNKILTILFTFCISLITSFAQSVAGLFPLEGSGRVIYNFNDGWHYLLGDAKGAEAVDYDDSAWDVVSTPHTARLEPSEVSGCRNYQGICWYRKQFIVPSDLQGKEITIHFEAIMGKQEVYVNGRLVKQHLGGYLPITIDLSKEGVKAGDKCLVAVKADNSDDKSYPPGKKQTQLDFAYHGGMYRDVWLIGKSPIHITDAIERGQVAGGGVFLHYNDISEKSAGITADVEVEGYGTVSVIARIKDAEGREVKTKTITKTITKTKTKTSLFTFHFSLRIAYLCSIVKERLCQQIIILS